VLQSLPKIEDLIATIYPGLNPTSNILNRNYFSKRTILSSRNCDADDINKEVLQQFPGEVRVFLDVDSAKASNSGAGEEMMYPHKFLNTINCSGLPIAHLELKVGLPVMVLWNLSPGEGVCNGT